MAYNWKYTGGYERDYYSLSLPDLMQTSGDPDSFYEFAADRMSQRMCDGAERLTRNQRGSDLWHNLRIGRITSSNVYEASRCHTRNGTLVKRILGMGDYYDNVNMEHGRAFEDLVFEEVRNSIDDSVEKCGIFLNPSRPVLGASPDGIGHDFVLEIKCPTARGSVRYYLNDNGLVNRKFYAQIHLQMLLTGKRRALFCVADPQFEENEKISYVWIDYNESYMNSLEEKVLNFWHQYILPELHPMY